MKLYYLLLLILLLIPQPTSGNLTLDIPSIVEIDVSINKSEYIIPVTVKKGTTSSTTGILSILSTPNGIGCASSYRTTFSGIGNGRWEDGVKYDVNIIKELDDVHNLKTTINDAQKTLLDDEKGRYLCISFKIQASGSHYSHHIVSNPIIIRIWKDYNPDGDDFFGSLPFNNLYLLGFVVMAIIYRRRKLN